MSDRKRDQRTGRYRKPSTVRDAVSGRLVLGEDNSMLRKDPDGDVQHRISRPDYSSVPSISSSLDDHKYDLRRNPDV